MYGLLVNKDILDLLCLLLHFFRLFLVVDVGEEIKVGKKDEKYCRISHDDCWHNFRVTTVIIHWQQPVDKDKDELEHLQSCQISLPPEILLDLWSTCSQEIIEIHGCVNSSVDECEEATVTASHKLSSKPTLEWHDSMVIHMEERKMGEFLFSYEKERIKHVKEFRHVKKPGQIESTQGF